MLFASPLFLFIFLPLTMAAYTLVPARARNAVLLVASVFFYTWGEGIYLLLVGASVAVNWALGLVISAGADAMARRRWLALAIAANLATLTVFKYANFAAQNLNDLLAMLDVAPIAWSAIPLPLGISFFTFHAISYVVDVYKRNARAERSLPNFALYILLFPQLIAGPIIRWKDIASQMSDRKLDSAEVAYGVRRFALGLAKKMLIANPLGATADRIFALDASDLSTPVAWLGIACYTLQIYFDFSGYSDMALGLMRMFGFRILENFNYPYIARSVREFWRRWHISLSNWFRDYLYIPLGGNQRGPARAYANLALVFLLCGLWHGASWPFVVWGAWHGGFLVLERAGLDRVLARIGPLRHVYTLCAVTAGWVLFRCETLPQAGRFFAALLGVGSATTDGPSVLQFLDPLVAFTIAAAIFGATPIACRMGAWWQGLAAPGRRAGPALLVLDGAWTAACLVVASAWLAAGTYNPFIYFRF